MSKLPIGSIGWVLGKAPVLILTSPTLEHTQKCVHLRDSKYGAFTKGQERILKAVSPSAQPMLKQKSITLDELNYVAELKRHYQI